MSNATDFLKERAALITKQRELQKQKEIEEKEAFERNEIRKKNEVISKKNQSVFYKLFNIRKKPQTTEYLDQIDIILNDYQFRNDNQEDVYLLKEILDFEHLKKVFVLDTNILERFFVKILPNAEKKVVLWFLEDKELLKAMCLLFEKRQNFTGNKDFNDLLQHYYYAEANTKFNIKLEDGLDYRLISELLDKIIDHYSELRGKSI